MAGCIETATEQQGAAEDDQAASQRSSVHGGRACDGCPRRDVGRAFLQTTFVNVPCKMANLARGQVTARITPKTWWANMEQAGLGPR
jgi:hypothetical protein